MRTINLIAAGMLALSANAACAGEFPGMGDRAKWSEACDLSLSAVKQFKEKKFDLAMPNFDRSTKIYTNDPLLFYNAGFAHHTLADIRGKNTAEFLKAIEDYKQAVALKPTYTKAWASLGYAQLMTRQYKDAIVSFKTSIKLGGLPPVDTEKIKHNIAVANQRLRD
jgi:tetratricopeptide (TPR) repeat protein